MGQPTRSLHLQFALMLLKRKMRIRSFVRPKNWPLTPISANADRADDFYWYRF